MRHTSFRRRSGLKVVGIMTNLGGVNLAAAVARPMVDLLDADDPAGITCHCGVTVRRLACGRPQAHAAGGYRPRTKQGLYKCEGSGSI